jgi:diaminohydroxyphosphoribosylaminopyrimidine deaminase/5-amino-6-(5-phosphoribosylamino)uracil reductase
VGNGALVGAVLVRDGDLIAEGWHAAFGASHAERHLLENFEQKISSSDVLFVNLEPCCHHGKTPPCTDIIIERGIRRVVYGMRDPDPRVAGKGIDILRAAGIDVIGPVERASCEWLNRGFVSVRTKSRPWITLKQARMPDGSIANADGSPLHITSDAQDVWSHQSLRATHDAILVGVGTILTDDPQLTIRHGASPYGSWLLPSGLVAPHHDRAQPWRIILDPHGRMPVTAKLVTDEHRARTIIVHCQESKDSKETKDSKDVLQSRGVRILEVDMTGDAGLALDQLWPHLINLDEGAAGVTSVLVEGGTRTWDFFRRAGVVDSEVTLVGY